MDLGKHFRNSPIICLEGDKVNRANDLVDIILSISKAYVVFGYSFPINGVAPPLPSVSEWETKEELTNFIRNQGKDCDIAFIVFGKHSSPNI
jgi:hypothetical protein